MNAKTETAAMLAATVDQLAEVKTHISTLQARETELKQILAAAGPDAIEGTQHRAAITHNATRTTTSWEALARACIDPEALPDLIEHYTTTGQPFDIVRIGAKKTS
jgi:hypothetical protein